MPLPLAAKLLAAGFATSGTIHLVRPQTFQPLMPSWVPAHREVIIGSGVVELLCAAGLAVPATRKPAGYASALLLVGTIYAVVAAGPKGYSLMVEAAALDSNRSRSTARKAIAWGRMPLQVPMIRAALQAARSA